MASVAGRITLRPESPERLLLDRIREKTRDVEPYQADQADEVSSRP